MHGFYKIAAGVPSLKVADVDYNSNQIKQIWSQADLEGLALVGFPELCLSSYSCQDLFHQDILLTKCLDALLELRDLSKDLNSVAVVGLPIRFQDRVYNCAAVVSQGQIQGVVPKTFIPNYREFYEKRWFTSGAEVLSKSLRIEGQDVPFGVDLIFGCGDTFSFGIEICEDLWAVIPPSSYQAINGSHLTVNLSASNEVIGKKEYRKDLVSHQSAKCLGSYLYCSAGAEESTTDLVYNGHVLIAENGRILLDDHLSNSSKDFVSVEVDFDKLKNLRISESSFSDYPRKDFRQITLLKPVILKKKLNRLIDPCPFVPANQDNLFDRCKEIVSLQEHALLKRLIHIGAKALVVGVSGGLDSTLALLIADRTVAKLAATKQGECQVLAVTMPGMGTTRRTKINAKGLCSVLGVECREIDITNACQVHFDDIGHDSNVTDVTFENVQARERTQILMDLANQEGGIVLGTGDLSEIALGWSTYNGDHMSMYSINCGIPKTLIRHMLEWFISDSDTNLANILEDVLKTPVSPELLPINGEGESSQKTEEIIGVYKVHDFYLYHFMRYGASPQRLLFLAESAFDGTYSKQNLKEWLSVFLKRFFQNQFKRNCIPDGPKIGMVALSPRGDWRMVSDVSASLWLTKDLV